VQVAGHEVRVGFEGDLRIAVPEDSRNRVEIDAGSEEQRRRRVPRVVQAELARERLGPEEHLAVVVRADSLSLEERGNRIQLAVGVICGCVAAIAVYCAAVMIESWS